METPAADIGTDWANLCVTLIVGLVGVLGGLLGARLSHRWQVRKDRIDRLRAAYAEFMALLATLLHAQVRYANELKPPRASAAELREADIRMGEALTGAQKALFVLNLTDLHKPHRLRARSFISELIGLQRQANIADQNGEPFDLARELAKVSARLDEWQIELAARFEQLE